MKRIRDLVFGLRARRLSDSMLRERMRREQDEHERELAQLRLVAELMKRVEKSGGRRGHLSHG